MLGSRGGGPPHCCMEFCGCCMDPGPPAWDSDAIFGPTRSLQHLRVDLQCIPMPMYMNILCGYMEPLGSGWLMGGANRLRNARSTPTTSRISCGPSLRGGLRTLAPVPSATKAVFLAGSLHNFTLRAVEQEPTNVIVLVVNGDVGVR